MRTPLTALIALALTGAALLAGALPVRADGSWLDQPEPPRWNEARVDLPSPAGDTGEVEARCLAQHRPAETNEDAAVVLAGWYLIGSYEAGWGMRVVLGVGGFDGMCRPIHYQYFVFADGLYAGTVSPVAMDSRTDGAATDTRILLEDRLSVDFVRYDDSDPLCCPSRISNATYTINRESGAPVLELASVFTSPTREGE